MALFKIYEDKSGIYRILLKFNNRIEFISKGFASRTHCLNTVKTIRKNALSDDAYEMKKLACGSWYFELNDLSLKEVIGDSQSYISKRILEEKISEMKTNVPNAKFDSVTYSM